MKFMPLLGLVAPDVQGEHAIGWELSTQDRAELICLATIMFCGLVASLWYFWASTPFQERRVQKIEDEAAPENCAESPGVLVLLVLAIQAFLSTALVPGWPAFIGLLHQEGVYAHYCADISDCPERSVAFSFVFTVGSVMSYVGSLPAGYFVDYMGQRRGMQVGVLVVMAGSILMAIAPASGNLVWPLAFGLYGMGGCFVTLANFSASKGSSNLPIVVGILMALRVTSGMTLELFSLAYRAGLARSQACSTLTSNRGPEQE